MLETNDTNDLIRFVRVRLDEFRFNQQGEPETPSMDQARTDIGALLGIGFTVKSVSTYEWTGAPWAFIVLTRDPSQLVQTVKFDTPVMDVLPVSDEDLQRLVDQRGTPSTYEDTKIAELSQTIEALINRPAAEIADALYKLLRDMSEIVTDAMQAIFSAYAWKSDDLNMPSVSWNDRENSRFLLQEGVFEIARKMASRFEWRVGVDILGNLVAYAKKVPNKPDTGAGLAGVQAFMNLTTNRVDSGDAACEICGDRGGISYEPVGEGWYEWVPGRCPVCGIEPVQGMVELAKRHNDAIRKGEETSMRAAYKETLMPPPEPTRELTAEERKALSEHLLESIDKVLEGAMVRGGFSALDELTDDEQTMVRDLAYERLTKVNGFTGVGARSRAVSMVSLLTNDYKRRMKELALQHPEQVPGYTLNIAGTETGRFAISKPKPEPED